LEEMVNADCGRRGTPDLQSLSISNSTLHPAEESESEADE
jgi:hypothetical protein